MWEGDRIAVDAFTAPGVSGADGTIGVDFASAGALPVDRLNLNVALDSYNLSPLNGFLPPTASQYAQLSGTTSFDGQLTGTLENPQIEGVAFVDGLAVNELLFESLSGPVAFSLAEGGQVNLQGATDRLQVAH